MICFLLLLILDFDSNTETLTAKPVNSLHISFSINQSSNWGNKKEWDKMWYGKSHKKRKTNTSQEFPGYFDSTRNKYLFFPFFSSFYFILFFTSVNISEKMPCWSPPALVTLNWSNQERMWASDVWFFIIHSCKYIRCDMTDEITPIRFSTMIAENLIGIGFKPLAKPRLS